jgi:2-polyprenyl-3-methyl-5-hydroxy-6-metoxy-1,4-benzoquinol methylase
MRIALMTIDNKLKSIPMEMKRHYSQKFGEFGPTPRGVDWGKEEDVQLRYEKMLAVIEQGSIIPGTPISLLDVGCGYGGLLRYAQQKGLKLQYTGIDVASNMISWAKNHMPDGEFQEDDFMEHDFHERKFDFVVCNGILTQKLEISFFDMDKFAKKLLKKMFSLCNQGVAFNVMTTYVNYFSSNLYYKHPSEMLAYCLSEISQKIRIDHSYGLYEYTLYLYK